MRVRARGRCPQVDANDGHLCSHQPAGPASGLTLTLTLNLALTLNPILTLARTLPLPQVLFANISGPYTTDHDDLHLVYGDFVELMAHAAKEYFKVSCIHVHVCMHA